MGEILKFFIEDGESKLIVRSKDIEETIDFEEALSID
jgi:hypothetical protein